MKVDGSVAIISIKNFPIGLYVMYLYFPDTPPISVHTVPKKDRGHLVNVVDKEILPVNSIWACVGSIKHLTDTD